MSMRAVRATIALGLGLLAALAGVGPATAVDSGEPVRLAIAVPITVPDEPTGLISAESLEQYTRPLGLLTRQLDAVIDRPVAIGIDPMIIVSIRILGMSAPETALTWLRRLENAGNQTFPLTYADSDLTLGTQSGSGRVLAPESLDFAIDPALFAPPDDTTATPTPSPTPTPTPTQEPDEPVTPSLPTTEELLDWPYSLTGLAWPRDNTVVASDLTAIAGSDYETTIVASGNLNRDAGAGSTAEVNGERLLVSDDAVSAALRAAMHASGTEEQQATNAALSQAIAAAGLAQSGTRATLFATLDRVIPLGGSGVAQTITSLLTNPAVTLIPLSQAMAEPASEATVADKAQPVERVGPMQRMLEAESADRQFASIAEDPAAITSDRRLRLLAVASNSWVPSPVGWTDATNEYLADSVDLRDSVQVVESSTVNFLAQAADLRIAVSNELDQAVTVFITIRPDTALLAVEDQRVELTLEPNSQGTGPVPVSAISNGTVDITVTLASETGVAIGSPNRTEINVQAGWETPIVLVIAGTVLVVFTVGLVRNILRRRRQSAEGDQATDD